MIVVWLFGAVLDLLSAILQLVPLFDVPVLEVDAFLAQVGSGLRVMDQAWFPVTTLGYCMAVLLVARLALFTWNLVMKVYHQVWGTS